MNPPPSDETPTPLPPTTPTPRKRTYPKPPPLMKRMVLLALKPEAWPRAAMYPLWVTLVPLVLAIVIAAAAAGVATPVRVMKALDTFNHILDSRHIDLSLNSDGVLSTAAPLTSPISFMLGDQHIVIDPSGKTTLDSLKDEWVTLLTSQKVFRRDRGGEMDPLAIKDIAPLSLPAKGEVVHINSGVLKPFVAENRGVVIFFLMMMGFMFKLFTETLWVAATMFIIFHSVRLGAAMGNVRLAIPKRVACRIAAAVLVPLVLFSGLTNASGYSLTSLIGYFDSLVVWSLAAMALALWAGYMTKVIFTSKPVRRRTT